VSRPYLDPAERRIVWPGASPLVLDLPESAPEGDVVLLPPLEKDRSREKSRMAAAVSTHGFVLDHSIGERGEPFESSQPRRLLEDLLSPLLKNDVSPATSAAREAVVVVPLIAGLSDDESRWSGWLAGLGAVEPAAVVAVSPHLTPVDRRRLVEQLGEDRFEAIHHSRRSSSDSERAFARAVAAAGLSPFFERPEVPLPPRRARNRGLASVLFEAGERWLALGRGEADGAALLAAARHVESAAQDIEALARERQLVLLPFLSAIARRTIEACVDANGRSALLAELRSEWIGSEVAA
jgi:hypothetical protein